jgi:hypothetical protein
MSSSPPRPGDAPPSPPSPNPAESEEDEIGPPNSGPHNSDPKGSRLISRLLPPALRLWLHSQLDHLEGLDFRLQGQDRQILTGYLPEVSLSAEQAVYRGLHVSQVTVTATDIRVNLGQVLRGKPLRLLQPFPVNGRVYLTTEDVRASLLAPLLAQGLEDVFQRLVEAQGKAGAEAAAIAPLTALPPATQLTDLTLGEGTLQITWQPSEAADQRLQLQTRLTIREGRWLTLGQPTVQEYRDGTTSGPTDLEDVVIDLGPEANIQQLAVTPSAIEVVGVVRVIP